MIASDLVVVYRKYGVVETVEWNLWVFGMDLAMLHVANSVLLCPDAELLSLYVTLED